MNNHANVGSAAMEGRTFILGREGHIYISDPAASKEHAEIKLIEGRVHLRDLDSTNGVYLVKNNKAERFKEGYVEPNEIIAIGMEQHTVRNLLALIMVFVE